VDNPDNVAEPAVYGVITPPVCIEEKYLIFESSACSEPEAPTPTSASTEKSAVMLVAGAGRIADIMNAFIVVVVDATICVQLPLVLATAPASTIVPLLAAVFTP